MKLLTTLVIVLGVIALGSLLYDSFILGTGIEVSPIAPDVEDPIFIGELQTYSMRLSRAFTMERPYDFFPYGHEEITLAHTIDVVAGINLELLEPDDVELSESRGSIRVVLPPAEILVVAPVSSSNFSFVFSGPTPSNPLQRYRNSTTSYAIQYATEYLTNSALRRGILDSASVHAESLMMDMLIGFGYDPDSITILSLQHSNTPIPLSANSQTLNLVRCSIED